MLIHFIYNSLHLLIPHSHFVSALPNPLGKNKSILCL